LEREYRVDLSEWLVEHQKSLREHGGYVDNETLASPHLLDMSVSDSKSSGSGFFLRLVLIALFVGGAYLVYQNYFEEAKTFVTELFGDQNEVKEPDSAQIMLQQPIKEEPKIEVLPQEQAVPGTTSLDGNMQESQKLDVSVTLQGVPPEVPFVAIVNTETNGSQNPIDLSKEPLAFAEIYIEPKYKVWLGVIYLDTKQRKDFVASSRYKLDSSRPQIIITGNGLISIYNNGEKEIFGAGSGMRFAFDHKEGFRQISQEQFKELNGGRDW